MHIKEFDVQMRKLAGQILKFFFAIRAAVRLHQAKRYNTGHPLKHKMCFTSTYSENELAKPDRWKNDLQDPIPAFSSKKA